MEQARLYSERTDVIERLSALGVELQPLLDAGATGLLEYLNCTQHHPSIYAGIRAWAETVKALRDRLIPTGNGWISREHNRLPLVINVDRNIAIMVSTGDGGTGNPDTIPQTSAIKGVSTSDLVHSNVRQLGLFPSGPFADLSAESDFSFEGWVFLIYRDRRELELRMELSRPISMGADSKVNNWSERILLPAHPFEGDIEDELPEDDTGIEVEVTRRA